MFTFCIVAQMAEIGQKVIDAAMPPGGMINPNGAMVVAPEERRSTR